MSPRSAEPIKAGRVAIVGAATPMGVLVRAALERRRVPGSRVDLYGATSGEAVLSEYAGEARLIQEPDPEELAVHDVIFVCEAQGNVARPSPSADARALVIDLVHGAGSDANDPPLVHPGIGRASRPPRAGRVALAHPLTIVLVDLLYPLQRAFGVRTATTMMLRPASDFGDAGVEELRQQTVRLLNFTQVPRDVFGGQLAFNVIPQRLIAGAEPELEPRVADEVGRLLGWDRRRLALRLVTVPVFYGHAVSLRLEFERAASRSGIVEALSTAKSICTPDDAGFGTPIEASGEERTTVSEVAEDGMGGYWVWAVVGEAAASAARHAVELADAVGNL